jgi:acyl-CoA reductase-like NAD-dependent aldehyde dehydrogenase
VLSDITSDIKTHHEEVFDPVAQVFSVKSIQEAL